MQDSYIKANRRATIRAGCAATIMVVSTIIFACAVKPAQAPGTWINVTDDQNQIMAARNVQTGEVRFYASCEDAFKATLNAVLVAQKDAVNSIQPKNQPKEVEKAVKKSSGASTPKKSVAPKATPAPIGSPEVPK